MRGIMNAAFPLGITSLALVGLGFAVWQDSQPATAELAARANAWLALLSDEQRDAATAPLGDASRTEWHFVPKQYPGVSFADMTEPQRVAARALLSDVLSAPGMAKVQGIIELESVLRELESTPERVAAHRDPQLYWVQVFGQPKAGGAWAFRLQGHHVSLHFAVEKGELIGATPQFLGSNPHEVRQGPRRGERVLAFEEDVARALMALFSRAQRERAVMADKAPADVILGPARQADGLGEREGLPYSAMNSLQQDLLWRLIQEYVWVRYDRAASAELARIESKGREGIYFAWAGSQSRGQGHYYRIHGPSFVIEYDNTQNGANHVHTVMRDLERDFGGDLLRRHYEHAHGGR